ncbi:MAG: hypothetical protein HeimC2_07570 [Candidatus Heimdallarchaeota archaeon LC_2]|nr:MAG: hypothetical protein HeimC2_07570 [Candidatus Heimdallarchaeota archaeon LC_2]
MRKKHYQLALLMYLVVLLVNSSTIIRAVDDNYIGVEEGDTFVYIVDKILISDGETSNGYYLGWNGEDNYVQEGDEFTVTIIEIALRDNTDNDCENGPDCITYADDCCITYEITTQNFTITEEGTLGSGFILSTDWESYKIELQAGFDELSTEKDDIESFNYTIIDTSSEFGYNYKINFTAEGQIKIAREINIRFDKKTGMLLYNREYSTATYENENGIEEIFAEYIIKQKGYGLESTDTSLPGFDFFNVFAGIGLIVVCRHLKRKY